MDWDVVVIGAGAAGMMCAAEAGRRGRTVLVLESAKAPGEKIRISGGGRCNFTNLHASPTQFLSANPRFCISALSRYTQQDFIALVRRYRIGWHEKALGQLFCDGSAAQIIDMLLAEMKAADVHLRLNAKVQYVEKAPGGFTLQLAGGDVLECSALVVATGGKSIPKMGATDFGYRLADQFGVRVTETRAALVPLVFDGELLEQLSALSGVAVPARVRCGKTGFEEALLFTHRGLSGPAVLQISSYWRDGESIAREAESIAREAESILIDLAPSLDAESFLRDRKRTRPKAELKTVLAEILPTRLAHAVATIAPSDIAIANISDR